VRVLVVDDHAIVRQGVHRILESAGDPIDVYEAETGARAMEVLSDGPCDLVVLDIALQGRNGIAVMKSIKALYPRLPVLILSLHPEDQYAVRALRAGAAGYITKDAAPAELLEAVRLAMRGQKFMSPRVAERLATGAYTPGPEQLHEILSNREFQIFQLIACGQTVSRIAVHLHISVKTVSTHRMHVLQKLHLTTNAELTRYALERYLA
jgi:two-component system invasion response regulator UvrY